MITDKQITPLIWIFAVTFLILQIIVTFETLDPEAVKLLFLDTMHSTVSENEECRGHSSGMRVYECQKPSTEASDLQEG